MSSLADKLRKAREFTVEAGGFTFVARRPTDAEAMGLQGVEFQVIVNRFVVGWEGVKQIDIVPGGDPVPAMFDSELWQEWAADHPEFWEPIVHAVLAAYQDHRRKIDDAEKN